MDLEGASVLQLNDSDCMRQARAGKPDSLVFGVTPATLSRIIALKAVQRLILLYGAEFEVFLQTISTQSYQGGLESRNKAMWNQLSSFAADIRERAEHAARDAGFEDQVSRARQQVDALAGSVLSLEPSPTKDEGHQQGQERRASAEASRQVSGAFMLPDTEGAGPSDAEENGWDMDEIPLGEELWGGSRTGFDSEAPESLCFPGLLLRSLVRISSFRNGLLRSKRWAKVHGSAAAKLN
ncbi:hypothetical protein WJX84_004401 [Apatococcus fuscideae]|uniref:Uncharacterized protein n=1 Tax=Apatococcus fuscideae TaxID=2026836 RepID=A0AAW1SA07_9CHLO